MSRRAYPTKPKQIHLAGLNGTGQIRFLAVIEHGRGTREVAVDVFPRLILKLADALRATTWHACSSKHSRIADATDFNVGHAVWHVEHPDMPMPCIDHSTVIDVAEALPSGSDEDA